MESSCQSRAIIGITNKVQDWSLNNAMDEQAHSRLACRICCDRGGLRLKLQEARYG